jgi:hypothetical protein
MGLEISACIVRFVPGAAAHSHSQTHRLHPGARNAAKSGEQGDCLFSIAQPNELSHQPIPSGFVQKMGIKDLSVSLDEQGISVAPGAQWFPLH